MWSLMRNFEGDYENSELDYLKVPNSTIYIYTYIDV